MFSQLIVAVAILAQTGGAQVEWKPFTSAKGKYTVSLPMKPSEKKRSLAAAGKTFDLVTSTARKGLASYTVGSADVAGADPEAVLKAAQTELVTNLKGELKDEKPSSLGNFSGSELSVELPKKVMAGGGISTCRLYVIQGRLYELVATVPTARAEALSEDVSTFFESFKPTGVDLVADAGDEAKPAKAPGGEPVKAAMPAKDSKPAAPAGNPILAGLRQFNGSKAKAPEAQKGGDGPLKALGPEWKEFTTPEGKMSVMVPGKAEEVVTKIPGPNGGFDLKLYVVKARQTSVFVIGATASPDVANLDPDTILESNKQSMLDQIPGSKITDAKKIEYGGAPGRDVTLEVPAGGGRPFAMIIKARFLFANNTLYQVQLVQPANGAPGITADELAACQASIKFPGMK